MAQKPDIDISTGGQTSGADPIADADNAWALLEAELDAWLSVGKTASFWWRDDDAAQAGPKLDQLIDISTQSELLLAVIPTRLDSSLVTAISHAPHIHVAQHGYAHINHAPRGQGLGAWELGMHRGLESVMADLDAGRTVLEQHFASRFLPVVVPPWNRIAMELMKPIAERGYYGVSAFGPRANKHPEQALTIVNAHCDPIRWKSDPRFRGVKQSIAQLLEHLQARRAGNVDADEPTGLLTHHIDLDEAGWEFCAHLAKLIEQHAAAQWCSPKQLFGTAQ